MHLKTAFKIFFIIFLSGQIYAAELGRAAIFIGGIVGVTSGTYGGGIPQEMEGWQDSESRTTAQFGSSCGVDYEMRLYSNNAYNFLVVGLKNAGKQEIKLDVAKAEFYFSDGQKRMGQLQYENNLPRFRTNEVGLFALVFPSKEDFAGVDSLGVDIPATLEDPKQDCHLAVQFRRNSEMPQRVTETKSVSTFEISMGTVLRLRGLRDCMKFHTVEIHLICLYMAISTYIMVFGLSS